MRTEARPNLDAMAFAAGTLALAACAHWATSAHAAHPLLTEDTGTQGAGRTAAGHTWLAGRALRF